MQKYKISKAKKTILSALLLAMFIILDRLLTINTQFLGALGDLIGAIFWPFGAYFPGFTISVGLSGLIFGLFLHETPNKDKKYFKTKVCVSTAIVLVLINLLLNALWLNIMYGKAYTYYLGIRIAAQAVTFPIYVGTIIVLEKTLKSPIKKYLYKEEQE